MPFEFPHVRMPFTRPGLSAHTMVILSETGRKAANSLNETGLNFVIVQELAGHGGSMTVLQLARQCHVDIEELKKRVELLRKSGYVRFSEAGDYETEELR